MIDLFDQIHLNKKITNKLTFEIGKIINCVYENNNNNNHTNNNNTIILTQNEMKILNILNDEINKIEQNINQIKSIINDKKKIEQINQLNEIQMKIRNNDVPFRLCKLLLSKARDTLGSIFSNVEMKGGGSNLKTQNK